MKTLKEILKEVEEFPRAPDEARVVAWHRRNTRKVPDANGNGDDVFKGKAAPNAKMKRHGYKDVEAAKAAYKGMNESFFPSRNGEQSSVPYPTGKFDLDKYNEHHAVAMNAVSELLDLLKQHKANINARSKSKNNVSSYHTNDMKRLGRDMQDYVDGIRGLVDSTKPLPPIASTKGNY